MINKRGQSVSERLKEEIECAKNAEGAEPRKALAIKALGAADIAVEFGLITYKEWETYIGILFQIM